MLSGEVLELNFAVTVAKIPLGIGAKIGVKEIFTSFLPTLDRTSSISGVCW